MATPKPMIRDIIKRAPGLDNEVGVAYMRGDVLVRVIDCHRINYPVAHEHFDAIVQEDRVAEFYHMTIYTIARTRDISLQDARILWSMLQKEHARD